MKKLFFLIPVAILLSCSSDSDEIKEEIEQETENSKPTISAQSFTIDEHSEAGAAIGTVSATDSDNDELTFTIDSESGLEINETSGEITIGNTLVLDFEANQSLSFTVSVFDGKAIVDQAFELTINDINEFDLAADYKHLTIPKLDRDAFLLARITGWETLDLIDGPMNIYYGDSYIGLSDLK